MKTFNYDSLNDFKDAARELGRELEIEQTSMSYTFKVYQGRTTTELHTLHAANIKDKVEPKMLVKSAAPAIAHTNLTVAHQSFNYNDGGRAQAGYKGNTGDCVCRAICIATGRPYKEVYNYLAEQTAKQKRGKGQSKKRPRTASQGITTSRKWFNDYMTLLGFTWVPTMKIGQGCTVHLKASELLAGRLVVNVSRHFTAVIDGVINDTYDCSRDGTRCVYGYYQLKASPLV